jgi:hypothetical protein
VSDELLRAAERDVEALGGDEAASRTITNRLRAGSITRENVELAAFCGNRAAAFSASSFGQPPPGDWVRETCATVAKGVDIQRAAAIDAWLRALLRWGPVPCVLAAHTAFKLAYSFYIARIERPSLLAMITAVHEAVEAWIVCPCEPHGEDLLDVVDRSGQRRRAHWEFRGFSSGVMVLHAMHDREYPRDRIAFTNTLIAGVLSAATEVGRSNNRKGRPVVRKAIQDALIEFALRSK